VISQFQQIFQLAVRDQPKGFQVDSVEVSLGFSGKGQLVFIAEAGVEASFTLTFKRAPV
jgi:hypothetical protein